MSGTGNFGVEELFLPVLIFLSVVVGGLILFTLLNRHLYELRRRNLAGERAYVEEAARRLAGMDDQPAADRLLKRTLNGLRRHNRVVLFNLVDAMPEPRRSRYLAPVLSGGGKESLAGLPQQALFARSPWRRIEAIEVLGRFERGPVEEVLTRCLRDEDDDVVYAAVGALSAQGDLAAASALLGFLGTGRVDDKRLAAMLEGFPVPLHPLLWPRLADPDQKVRAWAATLLEVSREDETVPRLVRSAGDPDADVRAAAIKSLAAIGDARSGVVLPGAFSDEAWFVRASAARLAGALRAVELFEEVVDLLRDRVWWVRQNAKTALVAMCPGVEEDLVRYLVWDDPRERFLPNMVVEVLEASGAIERRAAELEKNPGSPEARRFFEALVVAEGRGSVEGLAGRAAPGLREALDGILSGVPGA